MVARGMPARNYSLIHSPRFRYTAVHYIRYTAVHYIRYTAVHYIRYTAVHYIKSHSGTPYYEVRYRAILARCYALQY